jgi:hypothetical protein
LGKKPDNLYYSVKLLQHDLSGTLLGKGHTSQPCRGFIESLNGGAQGVRLRRIGKQLELQGQFHGNNYIGILHQLTGGKRLLALQANLQFPCRVNATAPLKEFLWKHIIVHVVS